MLVAERHRKIVELVNEKLSVRVTELSKIFSVTEETIRRDLEKLEKENLLQRSHGGAVSIEDDQTEIPYSVREILNAEQKKAIAAKAVQYVKAGDQIVLDASTTAWYMAKELPDIPIVVLTNSIIVEMELCKKEQIKIISIGGTLLSSSLSHVGPLAERSLNVYHVNKAFLSCKGVHIEKGLSDSNEAQALVKQKMIDIADQVYLMVDSSKFETLAFSKIAPISDISAIISDSDLDSKIKQAIEESNVKVITA